MRRLVVFSILMVLAASGAVSQPSDTETVLVVLSRFQDDPPDTTSPVPYTVAETDSMMDSLATWIEEVSRDYSADPDTSKARLDVRIVGWNTIPDDGREEVEELEYNNLWALVTAVTSGSISADSIGIFDRYVFAFARPLCGNCPQDQGGKNEDIQYADTLSATPVFEPFEARRVILYPFNSQQASSGDALHELLHTYDLGHAHSISSISGETRIYGNLFEVMGSHTIPLPLVPGASGETMPHIQARTKERWGWIDPIPTVTASDDYRLGPLESALGTGDGVARALKIPTSYATAETTYYYLEFRRPWGFDDVPEPHDFNVHHGLILSRVRGSKTYAIDCTPETPIHQTYDCALTVGRSYTDPEVGFCITPLEIDADTLTVRINFLDDFPDNERPMVTGVDVSIDSVTTPGDYAVTFTANASDPDADTLSYFWNFGVDLYKTVPLEVDDAVDDSLRYTGDFYSPGTFGSGEAVEHTFDTNDARPVYLRVSDRKGQEAPWFTVPLWGWARDTVYVGGAGGYATISEGVAAAEDGDVVLLRASGSPYDSSADAEIGFFGKRITLRGETPDVTIDLSGTGLRAFDFHNHENGRSVVTSLTVYGAGSPDSVGGAVKVWQSSRPAFSSCVFDSCEALLGGSIWCMDPARAILRRCVLRRGRALSGGGVYSSAADDQGGLTIDECTLTLNQSTGTNTSHPGDGGGAIFYYQIGNTERLALALTLLTQNSAARHGGALYLISTPPVSSLVGNTVVDNRANTADVGGRGHSALLAPYSSNPALAHLDTIRAYTSVFWDHDSTVSANPETFHESDSLKVLLRSCLVDTGWWDTGNGNVLTDDPPGFVSPQPAASATEGDYSLSPFSLCIDAGRWVPGSTINDRYGNPRYDDAFVSNTGSGSVEYVDIGAVERQEGSGVVINNTFENEAVKFSAFPEVSFSCGSQQIRVGRHSEGPNEENVWVTRAVLDFSTTQIPDSAVIDVVELTLQIYDGFETSTVLQIKAMPDPAGSYSGPGACMQRFTATNGEAVYHESLGWNQTYGSTRTVVLGSQANADLEAQLGTEGTEDGWFSVGLRMKVEDFDDDLEIFGTQKLRVVYH